jgi:hypothetical protein
MAIDPSLTGQLVGPAIGISGPGEGIGSGPDAGLQHPWAWFFGLASVGLAMALGMPLLVVVCLLGLVLAGVLRVSTGDATTVLSLALAALFVIPQRYIFEPLGAAGTPAIMAGVAAFAWWVFSRMNGSSPGKGYNPSRIGLGILMTGALVAYTAGFTRPILPVEARNADRTLIIWIGYAGFLLLCADGVSDRRRLDVLLRRLVWGASYMSVVAMLQFFSAGRFDLAKLLQPPGLTFKVADVETKESFARGLFYRVSGTAMHPIEFSVVAVAILPIALHFAFHDRHRGIIARWTPVILIGFAMPLAISRSGFLGLALAGLCFLPTIPATRRLQLAAVGVGAMAAMSVVVPGLLGTVKAFFEKAGQDNSISARTQDYQYLNSFFSQRPVTGRGFGTFVPTLYDFLDNQYLLTAIEAGTIGVACLLLFLFSGMATARVVARRSTDPVSKSLAQALFAGVVVHAATFATYDALVFPTTGMTLFLTVGAAGALWRLCRESRQWTSAR